MHASAGNGIVPRTGHVNLNVCVLTMGKLRYQSHVLIIQFIIQCLFIHGKNWHFWTFFGNYHYHQKSIEHGRLRYIFEYLGIFRGADSSIINVFVIYPVNLRLMDTQIRLNSCEAQCTGYVLLPQVLSCNHILGFA